MRSERNYSVFTALPAWSRPVWVGEDRDRKVANEADPFKWSGRNDPPAIGARVTCYMNKLGDGVVLSYFVEYGWLGVLVQLDKNPAWRERQLDGKNPPAHLFGLDLEPWRGAKR